MRGTYPTVSFLHPISPDKAAAMFLLKKKEDCSHDTIENYEDGLAIFGRWTDEYGIDNLNNLTGRDLLNFKQWRKTNSGVNKMTLNGNLAVVKTFLGFCEDIEAVQDGLADKVPMPDVSEEEEVRMDPPSDELVWSVREFLNKYRYGSRIHVEVELIAEIGIRMGACRAIDEEDFYPEGTCLPRGFNGRHSLSP